MKHLLIHAVDIVRIGSLDVSGLTEVKFFFSARSRFRGITEKCIQRTDLRITFLMMDTKEFE